MTAAGQARGGLTAGKLMAGGIVAAAVLAGAGLYYLQVHHFYEPVTGAAAVIRLTPEGGGGPERIETGPVEAIDAGSSPIRFRACFRTGVALDGFAPYPAAEPLRAPGWFDCFDAAAIGAALAAGEAAAFLGERDITYGIDRVVAVFPDGRGFAWHQINACGAVVFDGDPPPEGCPPPPVPASGSE